LPQVALPTVRTRAEEAVVSAAPRVFISYAQHAPEHSARVLELALALRSRGIDADLDQFHQHEQLDWPRWCQERLRPENADWVLMVCSVAYRDRLENRVDPDTGKGVFWEGALIDDELYNAKGNRRFVPVLLDDEPEESIPGVVRGWTWFRLRALHLEAPGFSDLYRLLTGQPAVTLPPVGVPVELGPRPLPDHRATSNGDTRDQQSAQEAFPRNRATALLQAFFAGDDARARRVILNQAFGDCERDPRPAIDCTGPIEVFADHVVEILLKHGCAGKGRHSLSLLIQAMANARGRQTHADYAELPRLLDEACASPTREEELAYLDRLLEDIRAKARRYSALSAVGELSGASSETDRGSDDLEEADIVLLRLERRVERTVQTFDDTLKAFGGIRTVALLGAPGSGKSTTLRRLAADLTQKAKVDPTQPLPLFIALGDWTGEASLRDFIAAHVPEIGWALEGLAQGNQLVLLLDGLNEVPTARRDAKAQDVRSLVQQLATASAARPTSTDGSPQTTRIFVSCRRDDYRDTLDLGLDRLTLEPLTPPRVRAAVHQWTQDRGEPPERAEAFFWQLAGDQDLAAALAAWLSAGRSEEAFWDVADPWDAEDLPDAIDWSARWLWSRCLEDPRSLLRLAANPFMLNMLYQVWRAGGELPRNRGDLFARFVDRLLAREHLMVKDARTGRWQRTSEAGRLLEGLARLAWHMQGERLARNAEEADDFGVLTQLGRNDAEQALGTPQLLKQAEDATLLEVRDGVRFSHQLLQEYFTAIAMQQRIETEGLVAGKLWPAERWWARSGWEEAAVLLTGLHSDDCTPVIRWLKEAQPEVVAQCILDSGAALADPETLLRDLHDAWMPRLTDLECEPEPESRAAIGRALGRLGLDDRKGVGLTPEGLPDIDWVEIPGGGFIYQEGERRTCEPFRISRYPVTHAQFQAFLDAEDGYGDDRWWAGFEDPGRIPQEARWPIANHPRETVSWHEAMAFCDWLSHRLGLAIRLPTEWEWERAARGTAGRVYPWGNEYIAGRANIDETWGEAAPHNLDQTSAVGIYPQGASPEGLLDLSGNVWEWCLNEYNNPESTDRGGSESRVLRGGSWNDDRVNARADYRDGNHPAYRDGNNGFRVLCASPIR
jgi:hypothetical protein